MKTCANCKFCNVLDANLSYFECGKHSPYMCIENKKTGFKKYNFNIITLNTPSCKKFEAKNPIKLLCYQILYSIGYYSITPCKFIKNKTLDKIKTTNIIRSLKEKS